MAQIKDLKPNVRNPRRISENKLKLLRESIEKFGDLSGFVFNRRTKQLISGHQRTKSVPQDAKIKIEVKHESPTAAMTVAEGYVEIGSERFKYREVDADPQWEAEALLAANKHGGEWDRDTLRLILADFPEIDLKITGFDLPELQSMNISFKMPTVQAPVYQSPPQAPVSSAPQVTPVVESYEEDEEEVEEQDDAAYMRENPGPDTNLAKENLPSTVNAFETVEEKTASANTKILVVIECDSAEGKDRLKEKLRTPEFDLKQYGARMF